MGLWVGCIPNDNWFGMTDDSIWHEIGLKCEVVINMAMPVMEFSRE